MEAKEESLRMKNDLEKETKERRAELQKYEKRVLAKKKQLKRKPTIWKRERLTTQQKRQRLKKEKKVDEMHDQEVQELERISGLTSEQARISVKICRRRRKT